MALASDPDQRSQRGKTRVRWTLAILFVGGALPIAAAAALQHPRLNPLAERWGLARAPEPLQTSGGLRRLRDLSAARTSHETAPVPNDPPVAPDRPCPAGMVPVQGDYCTEVRHTCKRWLDDPKLPYARCGDYEPSATCVGERVPMRFCIDVYEHAEPGDALPLNHQSFQLASAVCAAQGKRICTEREWNFACEGERMLPYPYGFSREPKCNQDRSDLYELQGSPRRQVLKDWREPGSARPECKSPFGVINMVGNLDEPVLREGAPRHSRFRNALKGGWWMAGRNRCRPATTAHDDHYKDIQIGVRCCADVSGD